MCDLSKKAIEAGIEKLFKHLGSKAGFNHAIIDHFSSNKLREALYVYDVKDIIDIVEKSKGGFKRVWDMVHFLSTLKSRIAPSKCDSIVEIMGGNMEVINSLPEHKIKKQPKSKYQAALRVPEIKKVDKAKPKKSVKQEAPSPKDTEGPSFDNAAVKEMELKSKKPINKQITDFKNNFKDALETNLDEKNKSKKKGKKKVVDSGPSLFDGMGW